MRDLTRGPIAGHLGVMAAPIAVGMFVQTLYYLVDLYFVARLGDVALAGMSAAVNANLLAIALTQVLTVGTVTSVAQAVGAEDKSRANLVFNQAMLLSALLAGALLVGGYLGLARAYVGTIGADAATVEAGTTYLHWVLPSMALQFPIAVMGAALQGTGIVKPTMVVKIGTVVVNMMLTPFLVLGWGPIPAMGVAGAGLATTLAAGAGMIAIGYYFLRLERYVRFDLGLWRPRGEMLRRILGIGLPSGGEFGLLFVYMAVIYSVISGFGPAAQAGFGVGGRVMNTILLPAMAVAFAAPAIVGQNFGAQRADRVRATFRTTALINVSFMVALTLFCQWRPEWLVARFSSDEAVVEAASVFMTIISWNFVAVGLNVTCSGMFQGLGNTLPALASTATRMLTFVGPAFWLARQPDFKIEHVWYLSVATVTLQAILSLALLRWQMSKRLRFETAG